MSRVRYSFAIRGDAPIGPGGTLYSAIGGRVYDSDRNDVGHISHVAQTKTDLEIEVSVYGVDQRSIEDVAEESWAEGHEDGFSEGRSEEQREIASRLANWAVDEFAAAMLGSVGVVDVGAPLEVFKSQVDVPRLIAAIVARAEGKSVAGS